MNTLTTRCENTTAVAYQKGVVRDYGSGGVTPTGTGTLQVVTGGAYAGTAAGIVASVGVSGLAGVNNSGWDARRDMMTTTFTNTAGYAEFVIPLSDYFSFLKHYNKAVYGMKMSFEFTKLSNTLNSVFTSAAAAATFLRVQDLTIFMPKIIPSVDTLARLKKMILEKTLHHAPYYNIQSQYQALTASTSFQMKLNLKAGTERPRFIICAFQDTAVHQGNQTFNASIFCGTSILKVKQAYAIINDD